MLSVPCFSKREDFPYGLDKESVDALIGQCYSDRPAMIAGFGKIFFNQPISRQFGAWLDSPALAASGHGTAMCAVELRDADLCADLAAIRVPTVILLAVHDRVCLFDLAKAMNAGR
jgi:non-heme chloroperoxidase